MYWCISYFYINQMCLNFSMLHLGNIILTPIFSCHFQGHVISQI